MKHLALTVLTLSLNLTSAFAECRVRVMYQLEANSEATIDALAEATDRSQARLSRELPKIKLGLNGFFRSSKDVVGTLTFTELSYLFKNGIHEVKVESSFDAVYEDTASTLGSIDDGAVAENLRLMIHTSDTQETAETVTRTYSSNKSREAALGKALEASIKLQKLENRIPQNKCF